MALARALQVSDHLADGAAGVQLAEPGGGVGVGIVRGFFLLQVHEHHGHIQIPHGRKHVVGGGIGQQLQNHEVDVGGAEFVTGRGGELLGGADAAVDQLDRVGQRLLKRGVLAFKFGDQGRELGQIGAERDRKHTDAGLGFD